MSGVAFLKRQTVRLHHDDSVVIATRPLAAGTRVDDEGIVCRADVPAAHKLATRPIEPGDAVLRYGQVIGHALAPIAPGDHVHSHNLGFSAPTLQHEPGSGRVPLTAAAASAAAAPRAFRGLVRADGRVATRNYIGVVSTVNCSASVSRFVAQHYSPERLAAFPGVDGIVPITHSSGCGMDGNGEGIDVLRRTIAGYVRHPNFAGVVVIGLGCEANQMGALMQTQGLAESTLLAPLVIQDRGGTRTTVAAAIEAVDAMLPIAAAAATRVDVPVSAITLGLQCGGSDGYSGITANPALGAACDLLVAHGATVVLSETPEIYGAEHLLTRRAVSREVAEKLLERIAWWERYTARHGGSMDNNPSPGNKAGGLTTILEKSLGAVAKAGTSDLVDVIGYADPITGPGLVFMDTPGYDPVSVTGQVAGGANLVCFTTGRGSVYGCRPSPSLKLATNTALALRMPDDIDVDCGDVIEGGATVAGKGAEIFERLLALASGEPSRSEALGMGNDEFIPWHRGAVM